MRYTNFQIVDVETAPREDAEKYVKAASNLKDPAKIAASIEDRKGDLGLDINGARLVCVGWWGWNEDAPTSLICRGVTEEIAALQAFWSAWTTIRHYDAKLIGYKARTFDLQMLVRRSQMLAVPYPPVSLKRYHGGDVFDLFEELTFFGEQGVSVVPRTLDTMCEVFHLDVPADTSCGADIAGLVAAGDWDAVAAHNHCDLIKTRRLAEHLRIISRDGAVPARKLTNLDLMETPL